MKLRLSLVVAMLVVALSAVVAVAAPSAQGGRPTGSATTDVIHGTNGDVGTFTVTSFKLVNGAIRAYGTFKGVDANGNSVTDTGYAVVTAANGVPLAGGASTLAAAAGPSCQILNLTLGPLHLDLLGLVVDLNAIHLTITAEQGPGNLLGNLLCAVAGLLDNTGGAGGGLTGLLQAITNLLNQILAQLQL